MYFQVKYTLKNNHYYILKYSFSDEDKIFQEGIELRLVNF
jgi:hypothetical protein